MSKHMFSDIRVPIDEDNPSIKRIEEKCIKCGICKGICKGSLSVYGYYNLENTGNRAICIGCGQCSISCPTNAIMEQYDYLKVKEEIKKGKIVIFQVAPAVRVSIGEEFGMEPGSITIGKIVSALKKLGVKYVFDTTFGADLTIMEESSELIKRINDKDTLPMFTSCCPAWVKFVEIFYPEFLENLSTCKSPILMEGSMIKNYFAKLKNIDRDDIISVALTPCTAKKYEINREELKGDIDYVITTREFARYIKEENINFKDLDDSSFDNLMQEGSGGGTIFGTSGGVMESACRYAYKILTGKDPSDNLLEFNDVRGLSNVKEAELIVNDIKLKLAVINGTGDARKILEKLKNKEVHYDFIEVMACEGGCISGGGQPKVNMPITPDIKNKRSSSLYEIDKNNKSRVCYQNMDIINIYNNFLDKPLSNIAHKYLHTTYIDRSNELNKKEGI